MDSSMKVICMLMLVFASVVQASGCYESIISFGDSLADTGNLLLLSQSNGHFVPSAAFPYGETFFHRPTGRYSDGRLIIDFIGFNSTISACCGVGGPYNYNNNVGCKVPESSVCEHPSSYVSWDGIHLTEAAYKWIAHGLLKGTYMTPRISDACILKAPTISHCKETMKA
nr:GDSL esterase/lipase At1g28590-like [Ipomoea trifida]